MHKLFPCVAGLAVLLLAPLQVRSLPQGPAEGIALPQQSHQEVAVFPIGLAARSVDVGIVKVEIVVAIRGPADSGDLVARMIASLASTGELRASRWLGFSYYDANAQRLIPMHAAPPEGRGNEGDGRTPGSRITPPRTQLMNITEAAAAAQDETVLVVIRDRLVLPDNIDSRTEWMHASVDAVGKEALEGAILKILAQLKTLAQLELPDRIVVGCEDGEVSLVAGRLDL